MLVSIVKIGNSRGIRIPKPLLEQAGIADAAELTIEAGRLVIAPARLAPRAGWAEKLDRLRVAKGDDVETFADLQTLSNDFDENEWTWPEASLNPLTVDKEGADT